MKTTDFRIYTNNIQNDPLHILPDLWWSTNCTTWFKIARKDTMLKILTILKIPRRGKTLDTVLLKIIHLKTQTV